MICSGRHHRQLATVIGILITCSAKAFSYTVPRTDDQQAGPVIIPRLRELTLQNGENFTLLCLSNKPIRFKQQDIPEEMFGSDFQMIERNVTSSKYDYKYVKELALYNVDHFSVGYYACFDDTVDQNYVLTNITKELTDTEHIAYFYIYVNGSDRIFAPMNEFVLARSGSKVVIGCRPTTPDVKVTITLELPEVHEYERYDPKIGFICDSDELPDVQVIMYRCDFRRRDVVEKKDGFVNKYSNKGPPKPKIVGERYFIDGETFSLNCSVTYQNNIPTVLNWRIPRNNSQGVYNRTNENEVFDILYNYITIENAKETDAGNYICISENKLDQQNATFRKIYTERGFINLTKGQRKDFIETNFNMFKLHTIINDYPPANIVFYKDDKQLPNNTSKFLLVRRDDSVDLTIKQLTVEDTGNYTLVATNKHVTSNVTYDLRRNNKPIVNFGSESSKAFVINTFATLQCEAVGYPLPSINWIFINEHGQEEEISNAHHQALSLIKVKSRIEIPVKTSGDIFCVASNKLGNSSVSKRFLVYEIENGFGIRNSDKTWFPEGQKMQLTCLASKYEYSNLTWLGDDGEELFDDVGFFSSPFSHIALLEIDNISLNQAGNYTCQGIRQEDSEIESVTIGVTIEGIRRPVILDPPKDGSLQVTPYQRVRFSCVASAVPPPTINWYKDEQLINNSSVKINSVKLNHTIVNSSLIIEQMSEENKGKYECIAVSGDVTTKRAYNLQIKEKSTNLPVYLSVCGVLAFGLVIVVVYLMCKVHKEKQFRKELAAAGLLNFKKGVPKSLNPDLGIDEQAEMLPYDEKFEFPPEKLTLGPQLGAGAFGVVYKAEARGIFNAEESTIVAVKMVKKNADNMYIKALASELKIMIHLGKHVNILNLLGACTKNVGKRELIVIVEYCKFGNIHKYMLRHREVFIDQLTDNKEKNLGKVNRAFSCSSGSSGMHSDYFANHTQETDHTFVNSANTSRSVRKDNIPQKMDMTKVSENGYVAPEWRSNYESDYSFDVRNPRPLTSRDLLAWAFQIARGMEYLASRKVLHGDLAARNILLAEDNIVKICDFGLARSIYNNDEYQKKENSPLPVKWLAIECMTDRIFSTQSDVWSFGIVLWELFSLAKTPYPNISPQNLLEWLNEGHRLEKPPYADDKLYNLMKRCWEQKPTARPSFSRLQEILGSFLEENVRNHYVDLNSAYMDSKTDGTDYLDMVCAPDYNNMVTPSPHEYVNEPRRFFSSTPTPTPTQLEHDDEGYLMMNRSNVKFSPRPQSATSEATVHGSELTPMLTLNSLPTRSGSESDYDGNSSPYTKMCPRIIEEVDEVFETKQNNMKNTQNTAISNPTYTTFDVDLEKKPNNISNNYINVNVPNGLVN